MSCMQLEEQVAEVQKFYSTINDQVNDAKDKGREKHVIGTKRSQQGGSSREANSSNTMKEVMHQFSTIFHQASANTLQLFFVFHISIVGLRYYNLQSWTYIGNWSYTT